MAKIKFRRIRLSAENRERLDQINTIIETYQEQGYRLTLRQLYYQLVSRDIIPNKQSEYAKLSIVLKEGRMAGIVDWAAIEDRLRTAEKPASWETPASAMDSLIAQYEKPRMDGQENYLEVWVEKDALSGVLSVITEKYHIPILVNRGYSSVSAIYDSYKRFKSALQDGQTVTILYLGDYDPSGIDMIRDVSERPLEMLLSKSDLAFEAFNRWVIEEDDSKHRRLDDKRVELIEDLFNNYSDDPDCYEYGNLTNSFDHIKAFIKKRFKVVPIALTREQIRQYRPPPNPAKESDPRSKKFIKKHGSKSWEVDALQPEVLNTLLENAILERIDRHIYNNIMDQEESDKKKLKSLKNKLK